MRFRTTLTAVAAALALALSGCGDSAGPAAAPSGAATTATTAPTDSPPPSPQETAVPADVPTITVPPGAPPAQLQVTDVVQGDGAVAEQGDTVSVDYVGALYESPDKPFDESYSRGQPIEFQLGGPGLIAGFSEGVAGMKVGGRRQVVIPADKGYGPQGRPPVIPPNATMVFVLDLREVEKAG